MKKQFKLIKLYPSSPPLGIIATMGKYKFYTFSEKKYNGDIDNSAIEDSPEFWKEITKQEEEYHILSFKGILESNNGLFNRNNDGTYSWHEWLNKESGINLSRMIEENVTVIHSVKRLSDDEIFTIGDKVKTKAHLYATTNIDPYVIKEIKLIDNQCILFFNNTKLLGVGISCNIKNVSQYKIKTPLFTTEDGVEIFDRQTKVFEVNTNKESMSHLSVYSNISADATNLMASKRGIHCVMEFPIFSTKEAADEYVLMNKPCLSLQNLINSWQFKTDYKTREIHGTATIKVLIELVKSKQ